ncbi:hypothetical protein C8F04DRAFT_441453 [Mycena alexandri]|uniref:Uncharacterized protein n=1 Tax=Mycena alexandri TaxID=1745969 RepID=A0AAD6XAU6_9AGAR|nr:hypothetical protein C8F04DRAFT_441453 [Mycena alexandri]
MATGWPQTTSFGALTSTIEMTDRRSRTPIPPHHRAETTLPSQRSEPRETPVRPDHRKTRSTGREPWQHMADTYAWVEHRCTSVDSRGTTTEEWVFEQQIFHSQSTPRSIRNWSDIFTHGNEAQRRMREAEQVREAAARREREKARILEELKHIESRIRHRRAMERERIAAEKLRTFGENLKREQERTERVKADQAMRDAWRKYEKGWNDLGKADKIALANIPWPCISTSNLDDITSREIGAFLLSPLHSEGQTAKERIRRAQLRWHPDRFQKILQKMPKGADRTAAETRAGCIARCLNDLMAMV